MKASNTQVMVQAYRLLIAKMHEENMNYPLHLGVTEAGDGEDGRIKSAVGIGTLLEDGIGDTIRVSLTEDPEFEAPVAISLAARYVERDKHQPIPEIEESVKDSFTYNRRESFEVAGIGGTTVPKVIADFSSGEITSCDKLKEVGYSYDETTDKWNIADTACDLLFLGNNDLPFDAPTNLKLIYNFEKWNSLENKLKGFPYFSSLDKYAASLERSFVLNFVELDIDSTFNSRLSTFTSDKSLVFVVTTKNSHGMAEQRRIFLELIKQNIKNPVIIKRSYSNGEEETRLFASTDLGALLIDGFGDGVWLESNLTKNFINRTLFGILQACRTRISKTEYISCPSCGRTLFDLVEVTNKIRKRTEHLKGVKIAIMGCIVNGPGEMADADYGYVGSGIGKITLYRGKEIVKRSIGSGNALDELIGIIKEDGNWVEENKI